MTKARLLEVAGAGGGGGRVASCRTMFDPHTGYTQTELATCWPPWRAGHRRTIPRQTEPVLFLEPETQTITSTKQEGGLSILQINMHILYPVFLRIGSNKRISKFVRSAYHYAKWLFSPWVFYCAITMESHLTQQLSQWGKKMQREKSYSWTFFKPPTKNGIYMVWDILYSLTMSLTQSAFIQYWNKLLFVQWKSQMKHQDYVQWLSCKEINKIKCIFCLFSTFFSSTC